ncbi:MAG TPA: hypothetical protein VN915_00620 [Elusimicrobiota bacterium]|nr:hypothetical protein [Elusimicrobiota bacterium]
MPVLADRGRLKTARSAGPEAAAAAAILAAVLALLAPLWLRGLTPFWGDLTYLHPAWRAAPAELLQAGRAPLWEPSLYLGMPMAASMQGGLFYPPTVAYYLFGFATATALFQLLHYFLAGWLAALWLRTLRLSWGACAGAGISFALGGLMIGRASFLNHLAVLAWAPALPLFFRRRGPLALALALMFLAGYPTFLPGLAAVAWALAFALRARRRDAAGAARWGADWAAAAALALALTAAQLLPALELAALSRRAGGLSADEALRYGFSLADLRQWLSPLFVPLSAFKPAVEWWKCVYVGVAAAAAAALALRRLPPRRAAALAAMLAAVAALILGGSNPVSRALWLHLPPLRFVRYPGNLSYLAALPLAALVGAGLSRARRAPALAALLAAELVFLGARSIPGAPRGVFAEPGSLARELQAKLGGTRYLLSPRALEAVRGSGVQDWASRLYGLSNAPYRIRSVGNFGEPLVPAANYAVMDRLYSSRSAEEAEAWLPWVGASRLLTPDSLSNPLIVPEGLNRWFISRVAAPVALAYQFPPKAGAALPADFPGSPPPAGRPLAETREREDRFSVSGEGEGWVFVSEPRYPGWSVSLETPGGRVPEETRPAMGAFLKAAVPAGPWTLAFEYDPASWRWGVLLSLGSLLAFGSYWYHRASLPSHVPK